MLTMLILTLVVLTRVKLQPNGERIVVPRKVEFKIFTDIQIKL